MCERSTDFLKVYSYNVLPHIPSAAKLRVNMIKENSIMGIDQSKREMLQRIERISACSFRFEQNHNNNGKGGSYHPRENT
jgi:hypothetical protein